MTDERIGLIIHAQDLGRRVITGFRREATRAFDRVRRAGRDLRRSISSLPRVLVTARQSLRGFNESLTKTRVLALGASALIGARLAQKIFELGAAVGETASKFRTVLGPAADEMDRFVNSFSRMAGLSRREGRDLAATIAAQAQGFGFQGDQAARLSRIVLRLGGDLSSFNNLQGGTAEATNIVVRALANEFDALKGVGIVIRALEVDQLALANTGKRTTKELTEQERVIARLQLITERAGVANKDLVRTQDSSANRGKQLAAQYKDLADTISVALLPALEAMIPVFQQIATAMEPVITKLGELVTAYLAAIGVTNVFAQAEIRAINRLQPSQLEGHRERLAGTIAGMESRQAHLGRVLEENPFARRSRRELGALTEEIDGLLIALALLDQRIADLAATADDADKDIADLNRSLKEEKDDGVTKPRIFKFRRGLAPTLGAGNLTPQQQADLFARIPPPDPADTKAWDRYRKGLKEVTDEVEEGAVKMERVAPAIGAIVANIISASRGEGGGFLRGLAGVLGAGASVAAAIPGGQLVAGALATGSILASAVAPGREVPVSVDRYGPRAVNQMRDFTGPREVIFQILSTETGEIIDEILYEIRRGEARDAAARIPVGGLGRR